MQDDLPAAEATLDRLLTADPEFQPDIFDSPRFVRMVAMVRSKSSTPTVTSVSKSKEPLAEAPATVVVVTGEEIERRGYTDLEAVLRDLPGFDFSRRAGSSYSNIYQRGYRSIENFFQYGRNGGWGADNWTSDIDRFIAEWRAGWSPR